MHRATQVMEHLPLARPLANLLNSRARGISDLRYGFTSDSDWRGRDPLTQYDGYLAPIARLPQARYHFIGATLSGSGDTDLYLRKGSAPTTSSYDCKSDGPTSSESCTLAVNANGDLYVLLNGYSASSYTLTLTYRPQ